MKSFDPPLRKRGGDGVSVVMAPAKGAIVRSFDNPLKGDVQCRGNFLNAPLVRKEGRDGVSAGSTLTGISFEF